MTRRWLLALVTVTALAHGPLHEQITAVTAEIAKSPRNAALYIKRGELNRLHEAWTDAQADYLDARRLDPALTEVDLAFGRLWLAMGKPKTAIAPLTEFLKYQPTSSEGYRVRAESYDAAGAFAEAAADYGRAIQSGDHDIELYIALAVALDKAGDASSAIRRLDEAIRKFGSLVTLQETAIALHSKAKQWDAALARIDTMSASAPRKETWLARRGDVLIQAGRLAEARRAYRQAMDAIESLRPSLRNTDAMTALTVHVKSQLAKP